ncbi:titin isoform X5 [Spatholobus suberectus]|nr:titin isoform X5 [Spatholobus suberectus]
MTTDGGNGGGDSDGNYDDSHNGGGNNGHGGDVKIAAYLSFEIPAYNMEAETNSPEDASAVSVPLVESITNIGSEEIKFLQKNGNDINSKYPLVEETSRAATSKTGEVSETRSEEIYQESSKACVESEEQTEHQHEGYSTEKKIIKHTDSEGLVTTESIPKSISADITEQTDKQVHDEVDRAGESENIEQKTKDSEKSLSEVQILPREDTVNQVKLHDVTNFKATDSNKQGAITDSSLETDPARKEAMSRESDIATEQTDTGKLETHEAETTQLGSTKEDEVGDEFEKISPSSSGTVKSKESQDTDMKVSHKKSHGILSGVGSKVKHSISKVKKAITGTNSW